VTKITNLGKLMASFPINPRYGKMLALGSQQEERQNILSYIICLISGLSVPELFIDGDTTVAVNPTTSDKDGKKSAAKTNSAQVQEAPQKIKVKYSQIRQSWLNGMPGSQSMLLGDLMLLLVALGAVEYEQYKSSSNQACLKFCEQYGIRYKAILEARKLRKQLVNTVNVIFPNMDIRIDPLMAPPSQEQAKLLRQIVLSGLVDKIVKRYEHAITGPDGKEVKNAYQSVILEEPIFIHPSSVLFKELPEYVCYVEMAETSRMYMKGLCSVESSWLPVYLPSQCKFEKPIIGEADENYEAQKPRFDADRGVVVCHRESMFGRVMWPVKAVEVDFPTSLDLYKWFARFLLQGDVVDGLKKFESVLLASPATMLKSWAK
jgi:ATP-dependent RNA helicase DHX37/DHR1